MIRVTAGAYRGRRVFTGAALKARPVVSIIRESVFNVLRSYVDLEGIGVCDIFCGSGVFSFEALSRGAGHACLVDIHAPNLRLVKKTAASLEVEKKINVLCCDVHVLPWRERNYDLAFVDPPYGETDLVAVSLKALVKQKWCKENGIVILRVRKGTDVVLPEQYEVMSYRVYCGAEVFFMRVIAC